jgi:hypothetical protein
VAATAEQIARLRRMVAELTTATYSDEDLAAYIERYPLLDERGQEPYTWTSTSPPIQEANPNWIATYDLHAAAGDVWEEKAAALAGQFDFEADGGKYSRSQAQEQALGQARYHRSRRCPTSMQMIKWPAETMKPSAWIGNLPEEDG